MTTPPNPTAPMNDQQLRSGQTLPNGTSGSDRPLPDWWADCRARHAAWRRHWRPVLLWVAIIFGVLSFLAVAATRP